jgi:hypothetical protein
MMTKLNFYLPAEGIKDRLRRRRKYQKLDPNVSLYILLFFLFYDVNNQRLSWSWKKITMESFCNRSRSPSMRWPFVPEAGISSDVT